MALPPICSRKDCKNLAWAKGFCSTHYDRFIGKNATPMDAPIRAKRSARTASAACSVAGCERPERSLKLCNLHYKRSLRGIPFDRPERKYTGRRSALEVCSIPDCESPACHIGLCKFHYHRQHRGTPTDAPVRKKNGVGHVAKNGYRRLVRDGRQLFEHQLVMEHSLGRLLLPHETVHHKNGDRLDQRLVKGHEVKCPGTCCNLELWSHAQPSGQRVSDKVAWARELLRIYGAMFPEEPRAAPKQLKLKIG